MAFPNSNDIPRVTFTIKCADLIAKLKEAHGELVFHQSGGCCDGSQPMCFEKNDFKIGYSDVMIGEICDCGFWMSKDQFEYWKHTQLEIDVVDGRGSSFSLEIPHGKRFMVNSRLFDAMELEHLVPLRYLED